MSKSKKEGPVVRRPRNRGNASANWEHFKRLQAQSSAPNVPSNLSENLHTTKLHTQSPIGVDSISSLNQTSSISSLPSPLSQPISQQHSSEIDNKLQKFNPFPTMSPQLNSNSSSSIPRNQIDQRNKTSEQKNINVDNEIKISDKRSKRKSRKLRKLQKKAESLNRILAEDPSYVSTTNSSSVNRSESASSSSIVSKAIDPGNKKSSRRESALVRDVALPSSAVYRNKFSIGQSGGIRPKYSRDMLVAIDCEMVGVGDGTTNMLARVSLVDSSLNCIYDTFVRSEFPVVNYRTQVSGIRAEDEQNGANYALVRRIVASLLNNRIVVGHALNNDLNVLNLKVKRQYIRDTAKCRLFRNPKNMAAVPSLRHLAQKFLNKTIQEGEHSSIIDAKTTMELYLLYRNEWEKAIVAQNSFGSSNKNIGDVLPRYVFRLPSKLHQWSSSSLDHSVTAL